HAFAGEGGLHRRPAAVYLPPHAGGQGVLVREVLLHQVDVGGIAHEQVALLQGGPGPAGEIRPAAGAQPDDSHFHRDSFLATATVTPFFASLGTMIRPPAHTAARSHTLSTPVTPFTKSEGVKSPSAAASTSAGKVHRGS